MALKIKHVTIQKRLTNNTLGIFMSVFPSVNILHCQHLFQSQHNSFIFLAVLFSMPKLHLLFWLHLRAPSCELCICYMTHILVLVNIMFTLWSAHGGAVLPPLVTMRYCRQPLLRGIKPTLLCFRTNVITSGHIVNTGVSARTQSCPLNNL